MANDVKLLLVDDNPMVLGMLRQALTPFARVVAAGDAADALLKAVDDPPDLVVCDYRMPGMDGRQLVERLKSRPATANFSAILMASRVDIDERLSPQDAADDYLAKPFFLKEATRRIKRTVDRIALEKMAKTAPSDGVVRGNLSQMNVIDLMQSLEMGRKSCQLKLNNEGDKCEVFFVEGQVKHATYGALSGDEAVFKVLRWTGGNFELNFEGKTDQETAKLNTQGLLMEGLRLLDESQRDGGGEPASAEDSGAGAGASAASSAPSSGPLLARAAAGGGGKRKKMSSSTVDDVVSGKACAGGSHRRCGYGQRFLRPRGTRGCFWSGGCRSSEKARLSRGRYPNRTRRFHADSERPGSSGVGSPFHRNHGWDRHCPARRHSGGDRSDLRSSD